MTKLPEELVPYLGEYKACLYDSASSQPVMWGYPVHRHMGEELWAQAQKYGTMECTHDYPQKWFLITKYLTVAEARKQYGEVTDLEVGPRGGFRSVTYGEKKFRSKFLDPRKETES